MLYEVITVRQDFEYKRNGTRNLFGLVEPKAGFRQVLVTQRRTKQDFAQVMRYLVDVVYPDPECIIDVVMDNLNTHHYHSLVETFGKAEADRIMQRLEFHYTPAHASWLNMAEIELSILSKQCLSRRLPDEWTLTTEIIVITSYSIHYTKLYEIKVMTAARCRIFFDIFFSPRDVFGFLDNQ